jgi:hypothetical protein
MDSELAAKERSMTRHYSPRYIFAQIPDRRWNVYEISLDILSDTPEWHSDQPNPPVSAVEAREKSIVFLARWVDNLLEWERSNFELVEDSQAHRWYWHIAFSRTKDSKGNLVALMGIPFKLHVLIPMDGIPLEPVPQSRMLELIRGRHFKLGIDPQSMVDGIGAEISN